MLENTSAKHLWNIFNQFTKIPRPSKHEEKIIGFIQDLANDHGLENKIDSAGNIIVYVKGSSGREDEDTLIIQNHVDMVTDAILGKKINFKEDAIETYIEDGWLKADGTTLGADNGIGCAAALATIFEEDMSHPPLELLFTIDEETGLHGALGLDASLLKGKKMLNLDTEEWGSLYIGCAGGIDYDFNREYKVSSNTLNNYFELEIKGFIGGHSGLNIHEQRANAIKVFSKILKRLDSFELEEVRFGKAHNIIPRDGFCRFFTNSNNVESILEEVKKELYSYLPKADQVFEINLKSLEQASKDVLSSNDSINFVKFISLFPNGAHRFDLESEDTIVSCSNNLAKALLVRGKAYFLTSLRFFDRNEVKDIEDQLVFLADTFGYEYQKNSEYPSWKPVWENSVLECVKKSYENLYNQKPHVTAIHAGLECGILKDKIGDIEVCSFGPTIEGAHSPDEKVEIESVDKFWKLFKEVLKNI
ncbi:MAG: beta-Ala-His dipeptidase [Bacteriovoracaceae bacterium]|jgi:dipeptidase D|nr:beta-Ala-His dipeptidase [Bacteriovoracaceae bacterium]